jgi:mannose-1-phosphate guanylyltransferase/mannose-1-phosphate guanylyltransferase/mannose-6-phosphate isomerase
MDAPRRIRPVILSGGSGVRLWPLSRLGRPKQLLPLTGERSLLQETVLRVAEGALFSAPIVVAAEAQGAAAEEQLDEIGIAPEILVLEPVARNTAAAIALAALACPADELLLVLPSDHHIADAALFRTEVGAAAAAAEAGWLVTFGVAPDRAETGYGYIRAGGEIGDGVRAVEAFVEKPDKATAEAFLSAGGHYWNAGIFLFRAGAFLDALTRHAPETASGARAAMGIAPRTGGRLRPDADILARMPSVSVDVAVMEKHDRVAVKTSSFGWSDVGSWEALHGVSGKDSDGNAIAGDVVAIDASGCLIRSEGPAVAVIGVHDLVVVATERAVLIVPRDQSQRVQEAVEALKRRAQD